ncbi:hypothetical protein LX15_002580 [Streptoalloteichus tenebrarius]|uniref:Uncharacterized protein n=1 Tax=Streptoalloteichus tenebrarius (strain ATCC 17920 / DSM 40477 / JCM 4838 / CBS 697.72 / NBRC 16177 / NCIMB 11028 / NRRL B-12390 / A12253. 1 / ISP 5477) TaxID=1933 RepID=A0ABT1HTP6_STRSD|nr:hypothetical protein [Streptoalloteichus tenebrarius]
MVPRVGVVELRRIAVDWSSRGGPVAEPPERVEWPVANVASTVSRAVVEFDTPRLPTRVVLYRYSRVGGSGVPDESAGTEVRCGAAPGVACWREGDGREPARVVVPFHAEAGSYWVVHAAWPVLGGHVGQDVEVVSASWAVRVVRGS